LVVAIGLPVVTWCIIIVALLVFHYPKEIRRVPGPEGMEAVLKYGPSLNPFCIPLLPLCGTHNNCHVFVDVEKEGRQIMYLTVASCGDLPEDHDESEILWRNGSLIVIDEHSGHTNIWNFEPTGGAYGSPAEGSTSAHP
jgi:hypothetical protein